MMRTIFAVLTAATLVSACSREEPRVAADLFPAPQRPDVATEPATCPACPRPEPCPACPEPDAVYFTLLSRTVRGEVDSFITRALVQQDGAWIEMANLGPDGPMTGGVGLRAPFELGDQLLAQVRREPHGTGTPLIGSSRYLQFGPLLVSSTSAPIESGTAYLFSVFAAVP